jgi:hypothetical protein
VDPNPPLSDNESDRLRLLLKPQLRSLTVRLDVTDRNTDPFIWLDEFLSSSHDSNRIEHLHIVYTRYIALPTEGNVQDIFEGWKSIDRTLTGPLYRALKSVKFTFSHPAWPNITTSTFWTDIKFPSSSLRARGLLTANIV